MPVHPPNAVELACGCLFHRAGRGARAFILNSHTMKITIAPYNPDWPNQFQTIKQELAGLLRDFQPAIEHFGSTSVPGLAAKPFIDILVGLASADDFDQVVKQLVPVPGYLYYECYNPYMPERRLFVKLKEGVPTDQFPKVFTDVATLPHEAIQDQKWAHIHIWEMDSPGWIRHIAFRDYLMAHPEVKLEYQQLKQELSQREWRDVNEYNEGKDRFIKMVEAKAVVWYKGS